MVLESMLVCVCRWSCVSCRCCLWCRWLGLSGTHGCAERDTPTQSGDARWEGQGSRRSVLQYDSISKRGPKLRVRPRHSTAHAYPPAKQTRPDGLPPNSLGRTSRRRRARALSFGDSVPPAWAAPRPSRRRRPARRLVNPPQSLRHRKKDSMSLSIGASRSRSSRRSSTGAMTSPSWHSTAVR